MWAEGKNTMIEQLYLLVQDTFQQQSQNNQALVSQSLDPLVQGLAGPATANTSFNNISMNNNPNQSAANISAEYPNHLAKNLEQTLQGLEDSFWYILNNPVCYSEIIWRFFDKSSLFCIFPHCESFFKTYRLTGRSQTMQLKNQTANVIGNANAATLPQDSRAATGLGSLEEIIEVEEEIE